MCGNIKAVSEQARSLRFPLLKDETANWIQVSNSPFPPPGKELSLEQIDALSSRTEGTPAFKAMPQEKQASLADIQAHQDR
jgi:hypothetical protein